MQRPVIPVFAVLACLLAAPASAHPPPLGLTGFTGGALHPLFVVDHVMAVLAMGLMLLGFLSLTCGLILDTVTRGRWEAKRMAYLAIPGPKDLDERHARTSP